MNAVQPWFSTLQRKCWRIADFASKEPLRANLDQCIQEWNQHAYPFHGSTKFGAMIMAEAPALAALEPMPIASIAGILWGNTSRPAEPDPGVTSQRMCGVIGGYPTTCGSASSRCSRRGSRTRWGATSHASRIVGPWMPSSSSFAPGADGMRYRTRASVPVVRRTAAFRSGRRPVSSSSSGSRDWRSTRPGRGWTGRGWPWTRRRPKLPLGGQNVGKHPTDRGTIGPQRSVLTDGGGGPSGLAAEGAHRNDANMVQATLTSIPVQRPMPTARDATTDIEQPYPGAM